MEDHANEHFIQLAVARSISKYKILMMLTDTFTGNKTNNCIICSWLSII